MKKLFVISGSSGVGKGTVIKAFLSKNPSFKLSVSCTTRAPRDGEIDGINYYFITKEEFLSGIENDEFLEWAEFSGNFYGTRKDFVLKSLEANQDVLLEIETQGALKIKKKLPDAVMIFIAPPSIDELETRLRGRKTETEEAIQHRLDAVKMEIKNSQYYDYVIVNDSVDNAVTKIENIIKKELVC